MCENMGGQREEAEQKWTFIKAKTLPCYVGTMEQEYRVVLLEKGLTSVSPYNQIILG